LFESDDEARSWVFYHPQLLQLNVDSDRADHEDGAEAATEALAKDELTGRALLMYPNAMEAGRP